MIEIDGAAGEGGGQVLRNALALSLITGEAFHITDIRGRRSKPGMMRQHVTALEAACEIGSATADGMAIGAGELTFRPGRVRAGDYHFAVGSAGSATLILQTVLLPLALVTGSSRLVLEGGTHNTMAPPFEFLRDTFLPLINRMGPQVTARLVRHGFYPRGGGRIEVMIEPAPLRPFTGMERGELRTRAARILFTGIPFSIAERMRVQARQCLPEWPQNGFAIHRLPDEQGPGIILLLTVEHAHVAEVVSACGRLGVSAEKLASNAATHMLGYLRKDVFAGPHLADQLVMPLALAGGCFTTVKPGSHSLTAARIARMFTGRRLAFRQTDGHLHQFVAD
ncbi:MAG: RNA 3'-terminal phosphate cyclase [Geminicoccaceae bacterium]|nr:RNA 3'-terminal phosphate cyclase [Geminicoccaceae bacterium]